MDISAFLNDWIAVSNSHDTEKYLHTYNEDAVLDDSSVGRKFMGHAGIRDYFSAYFIGYNTQTELVKMDIQQQHTFMEVIFTGDFPERKIRGTFDFTFKYEKIATVTADLI